jgi:hypothetical protein
MSNVATTVNDKVHERPAESITGFAAAVMLALNAFGVPITEQQNLAILGVIGFLPAGVTWFVNWRRRQKEA